MTATLTTLVSFDGADGAGPYAGLIADANGDLFGTTSGTVFEIAETPTGFASTPTTLVTFYGETPLAGLIADAEGDLFGTTSSDGAFDYGTVFEIAKTCDAATPARRSRWSASTPRTTALIRWPA